MSPFEALPDDILHNILQYSNGKELAQCGMVCRRFFAFTELDYEWKLRCERDWNIFELPQNFTTWKDCYVVMYGRFGQYLTCYKRVSNCWEKIFAVTQERCPPIYASLCREGIDEDTLRRGLNLDTYAAKLPLEYRCSYRLCNGQRIRQNNAPGDSYGGLFGASFPNARCNNMCSYPSNCRSIRRCCLTFIFITEYGPGKRSFSLCVRDAAGTSAARCDCQQDADHERLNGSVVSWYPDNCYEWFIYGNSFIEFLEDFADRITQYPVVNHRFLSYDFNAECDTGPFTVSVRTKFDRRTGKVNLGEPREFRFLYRITMRMHPDASQSDSCQLETRHLITTGTDGAMWVLDQYTFHAADETEYEFYDDDDDDDLFDVADDISDDIPTMRPGVEFSWISGTSCSTPTGKMTGYFEMRKLNTGEEFRIACPEVHLVGPAYVPAI